MADWQGKDGMISMHYSNPKKMKHMRIKSKITYVATLPVMILAAATPLTHVILAPYSPYCLCCAITAVAQPRQAIGLRFRRMRIYASRRIKRLSKKSRESIHGALRWKLMYAAVLILLLLSVAVPFVHVIHITSQHCLVVWDPDFISKRNPAAESPYCKEQLLLSPVLASSIGIGNSFSVVVATMNVFPESGSSNRTSRRWFRNTSTDIILWLLFVGLWPYWKKLKSLRLAG